MKISLRTSLLDLTFSGSLVDTFSDVLSSIAPITGFNLLSASGVTGIDQSDLSFTANSIAVDIGDANWGNDGSFITAQMVFGEVAAVPEPATLALFGVVLAGLGFARGKQ